MAGSSLKEGFRGALLGTFVGDALGAPVKGMSPDRLHREHGELSEMEPSRVAAGRYTDDTQMMIAVAEWLLESEEHDPGELASRLVKGYDPARGYGQGTTNILRRIGMGESWQTASEAVFPRGSFGNSAATRAVPCALLGYHDPDSMGRFVEDSALATHSHPLGLAGALLHARQVEMALTLRGEEFDPIGFVVPLRSGTESLEFRHKLETVEWLLEHPSGVDVIRRRLGTNATALGSVPTALYAFLAHPESFEAAVTFAVNLAGDTDSVGAMTGAIAGAYHGDSLIPARWRAVLEEGDKGASYVIHLADQLFRRCPRVHHRSHIKR